MGRNLSREELIAHKDEALKSLDTYMMSLIDSHEQKIQNKSDKLSYWIEDWVTFLDFEPRFSSASLRRYKRGEIIKAHLGYNVGSEEGGLHYCVVIDKNNSKNSPVITIIPLTSVKPWTDIKNLKKGSIYLGNELFTNLSSKISLVRKTLDTNIHTLQKRIDAIDAKIDLDEFVSIQKDIESARKEQSLLFRMMNEVDNIRKGSIALTNQISTISKIRIYDPKTNFDILSNVKLSNEKLDLIDNEILRNLTGHK